MIPEALDVEKYVSSLEAMAEAKGWNLAMTIYQVVATDQGFMSIALPVQPFDIEGAAPDDALNTIAFHMQKGEKLHLIASELPQPLRDGFLGLVLYCEGFGATPDMMEQHPGRAPADVPGALEFRWVSMYDCAGRVTACIRPRGEKSAVFKSRGGGQDRIMGLMLRAFLPYLPEGGCAPDAWKIGGNWSVN